MRALVTLILVIVCVFEAIAETKVKLTPNNVIDVWAAQLGPDGTPAGWLLDEQDVAGDPASGKEGKPQNPYFPGWSPSWYYPNAYAVIDLQGNFILTSLWFYHTTGAPQVTVSVGNNPFQWSQTYTITLSGYLAWTQQKIDSVSARYIRIQLMQASNSLMEVVVYGNGTTIPVPDPKPRQTPLLSTLIGTNGFVWTTLDQAKAIGSLRQYLSWGYIEGDTNPSYPGYPKNQNAWQPSIWHGGWYHDTWYSDFKNAGILVHQCNMQTAPFLHNASTDADWKAVPLALINNSAATTDPKSYIAHADHCWQTAARYGNTKQPANLLKLAPGQPVVSGLGLLEYIEMWNEQDKWWKDKVAFFSPYEYSAMLSADYDGHAKTLGTTIGAKNADPTIKVVMGGIEEISLDYIRAMKLWSDFNRPDKLFPAEVINMHFYCNNGLTGSTDTIGISPEDCKLKDRLLVVRDWIDRYLPGVEFWLSEFGYDSNSASPQGVPAIGSFDSYTVQAQWIIRTFLAIAGARLDRSHQYWLTDEVGSSSPFRFATSGLIDNNNKPKTGWYFVYTMKNRLGKMRFIKDSTDSTNQVNLAKFAADDNTSAAYVVWSPTASARVVQNYKVQLEGNPVNSTLVSLVPGQINGEEQPLVPTSGFVTISVSETPVFIMVKYK